MPKPKFNRNSLALELRTNGAYKPKVAKNPEDRAKQRDKWERGAKYKSSVYDDHDETINESVQHGDTVKIKTTDDNGKPVEKKGLVKNPNAPLDMIGVVVDGKYTLIDPEDITIVTEALNRMRELSK